jgi:hypothetical protein
MCRVDRRDVRCSRWTRRHFAPAADALLNAGTATARGAVEWCADKDDDERADDDGPQRNATFEQLQLLLYRCACADVRALSRSTPHAAVYAARTVGVGSCARVCVTSTHIASHDATRLRRQNVSVYV